MTRIFGCLCLLTIILSGCASDQSSQEQISYPTRTQTPYITPTSIIPTYTLTSTPYPPGFRPSDTRWPSQTPGPYQSPTYSAYIAPTSKGNTTSDGCPYGCTEHKAGCDIKGNISFNTGEKIYHVPGGYYYDSTVINPAYGERWFCTEAEAIANGWRRSDK